MMDSAAYVRIAKLKHQILNQMNNITDVVEHSSICESNCSSEPFVRQSNFREQIEGIEHRYFGLNQNILALRFHSYV